MNHALSRMKNKKRKLHPQGRSQEFSKGKEGGGGMSHFVQQRALNKLSCRPPCRHQLKIKAHTKNPPPAPFSPATPLIVSNLFSSTKYDF